MFDERIRRRWQLWWGAPSWRRPRELPDRLHRFRELRRLRDSREPEAAWRCCRYWQRGLLNKWNARQFAERHGARVPALLWHGRDVSRLPLAALPDAFVVRPCLGDSRRGVLVMADGVELLSGASFTISELRERLLRNAPRGWDPPLLVEAFVGADDGARRLPVEYRCHAFGEVVEAIEVVFRGNDLASTRFGFFTPDWSPLDHGYIDPNPIEDIDAPDNLDEMLRLASRLGRAFESYVRVDLFDTPNGCVFGELSSTPARGETFTPFVNSYFGRSWDRHLGERI